jgi:hypothetical protein
VERKRVAEVFCAAIPIPERFREGVLGQNQLKSANSSSYLWKNSGRNGRESGHTPQDVLVAPIPDRWARGILPQSAQVAEK